MNNCAQILGLAVVGLAACLMPRELGGQDQAKPKNARPRIGLVLSGGGARGAAHVGVIQVLEELRIPIHAIASNSMGAIVGGAYAYGHSPKEMADTLKGLDWARVISDRSPRRDLSFRRKQDDFSYLVDIELGLRGFTPVLPKGIVQGHRVRNIFRFLVPQTENLRSFDDLRIPYRAVATNIANGQAVILDRGSLPLAMAASMSIPGVFAPVKIGDKELIDGGLVNNIPIDVCLAMNVDVILAIDVGTPILKADEISSMLSVAGQMVSILMQQNVNRQLKLIEGDKRHILIRPDLGKVAASDFTSITTAIERGVLAARAARDQLSRYSVSEAEYATFLHRQRRPKTAAYGPVRAIKIRSDSKLSDDVLRAKMQTKVGRVLDPNVLQSDLNRIFGTGEFERVSFEFTDRELWVLADRKSWGPDYLRFGINIEDDFSGNTSLNLGLNWTKRAVNSLGGEWRNTLQLGERSEASSEFFQPVDTGQRFFVAPSVNVWRLPVNQFLNGRRVAEFDVQVGELGFDTGMILSNWAELRFGIRRTAGDVNVDISQTPISDFSFDDATLRATLTIDSLDNVNFPNTGSVFFAEWNKALPTLGADASYQRLEVRFGHAMTWSKNTLAMFLDFDTALDRTLPVYRQATRGGFLNLSGFERGELTGQHAAVARLVGYRQVSGVRSALLGLPVYIGGSIEAGSVTSRRRELFDDPIFAGSLWLGSDTPIGPVYVGYGLAEGGNDSVYLFVGRSF